MENEYNYYNPKPEESNNPEPEVKASENVAQDVTQQAGAPEETRKTEPQQTYQTYRTQDSSYGYRAQQGSAKTYYTQSERYNSSAYSGYEPKEKEKKKRHVPKFAKLIAYALIFGLVASGTFVSSNAVLGKITGASKSGNESAITRSSENGTSGSLTGSSSVDSGIKLTQSASVVSSDVSDIVEKDMPAIVSITNMSVQEVMSFFGGVQQQESESMGSGIIIGENDSELLIVTNNHVVEGAQTLTVSFVNDKVVEATVKGADPSKDLAVVAVPLDSIDNETKDAIEIMRLGDSNALKVGEPVIAIGNALGYGQSVTTGIVSALNRDLEMEGFNSLLIQTDAAINPGNSGGALLNANGELVGINTVKVNDNAVEGMGYAIPISDATEVIETLMNRETRTKVAESERGFLGIQGVDVTSDSAEMYNMPTGVYVAEPIKNGGADKAGISKGSIITKMEGITIDSMATLQEQLAYYKVGEEVELVIEVPTSSGDYEEKTVTVTLGARSQ